MELTCIVCPRGCTITYDLVNGEAVNITGNSCPRGKTYTENEVKAPVRTITGTVRIRNGRYRMLPVITSAPIPKEKIFEIMKQIHGAEAAAPVSCGDIIIKDVCGTGADVIASRSMDRE